MTKSTLQTCEEGHQRIAFVDKNCPLCIWKGKAVEAKEDARKFREMFHGVKEDKDELGEMVVGHRETILIQERQLKHIKTGLELAFKNLNTVDPMQKPIATAMDIMKNGVQFIDCPIDIPEDAEFCPK